MKVCKGVECLDFNVAQVNPDEKKDIRVSVHWHQNEEGRFRTLRRLELKINGEVIVDICGGVV